LELHLISNSLKFILLLGFAPLAAFAESSDAIRANAEGNRAYFAGKFPDALTKFEVARRAASEAKDEQYTAIAMYGLARANAQLCKADFAEKWFRASIELREKIPDDKYAMVTQNYLEFARYLLSRGRTAEAVPYMDRSVPNVERLGVESSDPIAYADFLVTYANALNAVSRPADAEKALGRSKDVRDKNAGKKALFKPEKYPTDCPSEPLAK